MKKSHKILLLFMYTFLLSGCDDFISQMSLTQQLVGQSPEQIYNQAEKAHKARQYNIAIRCCTIFIQLYPHHAQIETVYINLIKSYKARGQYQKAIAMIENFLQQYPKSKYCDSLKKERAALKSKYHMDSFYSVAWMKDLKNKNKKQYGIVVKTIKKLTGITHSR